MLNIIHNKGNLVLFFLMAVMHIIDKGMHNEGHILMLFIKEYAMI